VFYWLATKHYWKQGCLIPDEPLGTSYVAACAEDGNGERPLAVNALFDERRARKAGEQETLIAFAAIDWLFRDHRRHRAGPKDIRRSGMDRSEV